MTAAQRPPRSTEDAHFRILHLISGDPTISQRTLAERCGVSVGTVNYILKAFVERGMVKVTNFATSENKRQYAYILTRAGLGEKMRASRRFLARKKAEYEALQAEIRDLEAELEGHGRGGERC